MIDTGASSFFSSASYTYSSSLTLSTTSLTLNVISLTCSPNGCLKTSVYSYTPDLSKINVSIFAFLLALIDAKSRFGIISTDENSFKFETGICPAIASSRIMFLGRITCWTYTFKNFFEVNLEKVFVQITQNPKLCVKVDFNEILNSFVDEISRF